MSGAGVSPGNRARAGALAHQGFRTRPRMLHLPRAACPRAGTREALRAAAGLAVDDVVRAVPG